MKNILASVLLVSCCNLLHAQQAKPTGGCWNTGTINAILPAGVFLNGESYSVNATLSYFEQQCPGTVRIKIGDKVVAEIPDVHDGVVTIPLQKFVFSPGTYTMYLQWGPAWEPLTMDTASVTVAGVTGLGNVGQENIVTVYPNPASTHLTVDARYRITAISISDVLGQVVYSRACNSFKEQVDVAHLPAGIYFVKVNNSEARKFVKG